MRQIVLDTETTGLEASQGHRIIEIGCVEIVNRRITERRYQQYINPQREIDAGAVEVHGITLADLAERPTFADIAMEFVEFVRGAQLIIHNASFDVGFLNMELGLLGPAWGRTEDYCTVFDTLPLAREMHPGQRNSLDALCKRYDVSNAHRERHGALLDAELLADVYIALTRGQETLLMDLSDARDESGAASRIDLNALTLPVLRANEAELAGHERVLAEIDKASGAKTVWRSSPVA